MPKFFSFTHKANSVQRSMFAAALALLLLPVGPMGCTCTPPSPPVGGGNAPPVSAPQQVEIPVVAETPDQIRAEMKKFTPFSPEFDDARLKLLIKFDEIMAKEGIEGFKKSSAPEMGSQMAALDPATGQIAWRALACFNPDCPARGKGGGPYLFAYPVASIKIGPDGKLMIDKSVGDDPRDPLGAQCPVCGGHEFCRPYEPAVSILKRRQLMEELGKLRRGGSTAAEGGRTASDVMKDLAELDKLFIVPESDKVKTVNDLIAPIATGQKP